MSPKPRLPKRVGPAPALRAPRPPVITEADLAVIQQARDLRERVKAIYEAPCSNCGGTPTVKRLAEKIGVTQALLWRFINGKQTTLMEENFEKIQEWVNGRA